MQVTAAGTAQNDNYGYDNANRLVTLTYDANGNRTMAGYATGANNRITNDGVWTYSYDAEGNTAGKTRVSDGEYWTYGYDLNNQMSSGRRVVGVRRRADGLPTAGQIRRVRFRQQRPIEFVRTRLSDPELPTAINTRGEFNPCLVPFGEKPTSMLVSRG